MLRSSYPPASNLWVDAPLPARFAMMLCHGWPLPRIRDWLRDELREDVWQLNHPGTPHPGDVEPLLQHVADEYHVYVPQVSADALRMMSFGTQLREKGIAYDFDSGWDAREAARLGYERALADGHSGYVVCSVQSVDAGIHTSAFHFGFGAVSNAPDDVAAVGRTFVEILERAGLAPQWSGDPGHTIVATARYELPVETGSEEGMPPARRVERVDGAHPARHGMLDSKFPPADHLYEGGYLADEISLWLCHGWPERKVRDRALVELEDPDEWEAVRGDEPMPDDPDAFIDEVIAEYRRRVPEKSEGARALERLGWQLASQKIAFTFDRGWDTSEAVDEGLQLARQHGFKGYVYCHSQDVDRVIHGAPLYFGFAALEGGDEADARIGRALRALLAQAGFTPGWDGSPKSRIEVAEVLFELPLADS